jgi:epoxyqueuosine reductase
VADGVLDARRCLSWLSQSRLPELPHADAFGDRVYGCDICQDVCPWNTGADRRAADLEPDDTDAAFPLLREWLDADPEALATRYRRLYIPDRDGRHLQRNARVALANITRD